MEVKMRVPLLLLLSTWCLTGCGDNQALELPDAPAPTDAPASPDSNDGLSLQARINLAVQRITADTCFARPDTSGCEWADYGIGPAYFNMAVSTGEAILMVDDVGDGALPQLVRYRNRILGLYRVNGETIEARTPSVHLPKRLGDALVSFADPDFIAASLLTMVAQAANTAYSKVPLIFLGHAGVVFSHLVELAPEQPLVFLDLTGLLGLLPSLCAHVDDVTLATARAHFAAIASSLRQLMSHHNVRFVNASFGDTAQTLATDWSRTCGSAVPSQDVLRQLLHLYDPIYDALFNTEGVITAHAAANLGDPLDFPFDQVSPAFGNRVRLGFISSRDSGLDEFGRGTVHKAEQFPGNNSHADVFVNWRCEAFVGCADPHYELAGLFGLGTNALPIMASSYVNPLGLGRLINLRYANHDDEPMSNALIQTLKQELTPALCGQGGAQPCVYQDPIAFRQLEVYRQHYR
jgi:hypothetical protein